MEKGDADLFGVKRRVRRPAYEAALENRDLETRSKRASRVRWLNRVVPSGGMGMSSDTWFVFDEARFTFIDGHFVGAIVLTAAFAEHWMVGELEARGFQKKAARGLHSCIACARREALWPEFLLDRLDYLRRIRNPFVHLKESGHEHSLTHRSWNNGLQPQEVAEADARHAIETILKLVQHR